MPNPEPSSATLRIAENVRAEMARKRVTQFQLGQHLNLSQAAISRRVNGETAFRVDELSALADLLGVASSALMDERGAA